MNDKEIMEKLIELSPYSTIPNEAECEELFNFVKECTNNKAFVGGKKLVFEHTAVNKNMHLFIDNYHDPDVCPECIQPGILIDEI